MLLFKILNLTDDYLLPIIFIDNSDDYSISFSDTTFTMDLIKVNGVTQIKTDTSGDMTIGYVCFTTIDNKATCYEFSFSNSEGKFKNQKVFDKGCRSDIYGMKVNFVFETSEIYFSCSDTDGSIQVYFFNNGKNYLKYENCYDIYGYSIISESREYYIASDVNC